MLRLIPIWLYVAFAAVLAISVQQWRVDHYRNEVASITAKHAVSAQHVAELATKAAEAARAAEHAQAQAFDAISTKYEQDKADALATQASVIADLRTGNLRLRDRWATQSLATAAATGAGKPDAVTDDRAESAGRIVRAAADADSTIRALQAVLRAERQ